MTRRTRTAALIVTATFGTVIGCTRREPRDDPPASGAPDERATSDDGDAKASKPSHEADAPAPTEAFVEPPSAEPLDWHWLQPIRYARARADGALYVHVRERDSKVVRRLLRGHVDSRDFESHDHRLPPSVRAVRHVRVLTPQGVHQTEQPRGVSLIASAMGDNWMVTFPWSGLGTDGLALPRAPHPNTELKRPSEPFTATGSLRVALARAAPRRHRPTAKIPIQAEFIHARLPDGATKVVSGSWEDDEGFISHGVVITVDDADQLVHTVSIKRDYLTWASVLWIGDLDGDGFDEIGWGFGGIEDEAYFLTRFAEGTQTHLELYASGH